MCPERTVQSVQRLPLLKLDLQLRPTMYVLCVLRLFSLAWLASSLLGASLIQAQTMPDFMSTAVPLAQRSQRETSVPASVTLAQAIWETGRGRNPISDANNYYGIKAVVAADNTVSVGPIAIGWVWAWTKEWDGKRFVERRERFRKYRSIEDSFRDHGILLATNPRYAEAMRAVDDPREFARRIAAAGYATSPTYAADLIRLMDAENLYRFDLPRNAAEFRGQSEYPTVLPGAVFQIYFDVENTGFGTWSPEGDYYLASVNENRFGANARQELTGMVRPTGIKRWVITMVAPAQPGTYRTAWQLKHGAASFGPELYIRVHVAEPVRDDSAWKLAIGGGIASVIGAGALWVWRRRASGRSRGFSYRKK